MVSQLGQPRAAYVPIYFDQPRNPVVSICHEPICVMPRVPAGVS
jgi:hypothetical protein